VEFLVLLDNQVLQFVPSVIGVINLIHVFLKNGQFAIFGALKIAIGLDGLPSGNGDGEIVFGVGASTALVVVKAGQAIRNSNRLGCFVDDFQQGILKI
jgi:hypothetical protein